MLKLILRLGRFYAMHKSTINAAKGIGVGLLAGAAVAAVTTRAMNMSHRQSKHLKKNAGKVIHTMGNLIGDVEKML